MRSAYFPEEQPPLDEAETAPTPLPDASPGPVAEPDARRAMATAAASVPSVGLYAVRFPSYR